MKKIVFFLFYLSLLLSCQSEQKLDVQNFKRGTFLIPAGEKFDKTIFTRIDSLQIEKYGTRTDTLIIHWKNNFNYTLKMLHPKTALDKELINVKITSIRKDSYDFVAVIGHSNYKQTGTVTKTSE